MEPKPEKLETDLLVCSIIKKILKRLENNHHETICDETKALSRIKSESQIH